MTDSSVSGFNMGVNCGKLAGQSIFHAHIHLIPRRDGNAENPRGGVRGVIPYKIGDVLPREFLQKGFEFQGERVPLVAPQGIFKPRIMDLPLSITTTPHGPYQDAFASDGLPAYKYRGTNPSHPDNEGLRKAMTMQVPFVYSHGTVSGKYPAIWPVFIARDDPSSLTFHVAVDDAAYLEQTTERAIGNDNVRMRSA